MQPARDACLACVHQCRSLSRDLAREDIDILRNASRDHRHSPPLLTVLAPSVRLTFSDLAVLSDSLLEHRVLAFGRNVAAAVWVLDFFGWLSGVSGGFVDFERFFESIGVVLMLR